jgi:hypothetical protein
MPPPPSARADGLKIFTLNRKGWLNCRETLAWAERVDLYNVQVIRLPIRQNMYHSRYPRPIPDRRTPVICAGFPALSSALLEAIVPFNFYRKNSVRSPIASLCCVSRWSERFSGFIDLSGNTWRQKLQKGMVFSWYIVRKNPILR